MNRDIDMIKNKKTQDHISDEIDFTQIECGLVHEYNPERGFGFVRKMLLKIKSKTRGYDRVFFHVSAVKDLCDRNDIQVERVSQDNIYNSPLNGFFWYEIGYTRRGPSVKRIFAPSEIEKIKDKILPQLDEEQIFLFFSKNIDLIKRDSSEIKLFELVFGKEFSDRVIKLIDDREESYKKFWEEEQKRQIEWAKEEAAEERRLEQKRKEEAKFYDVYIDGGLNKDVEWAVSSGMECIVKFKTSPVHYTYSAKRVKIIKKSQPTNTCQSSKASGRLTVEEIYNSYREDARRRAYGFSPNEEEQYQNLVEEIRPLNFEYSHQVSDYIVKHRLHEKYGKLAGNLELDNNGNVYTYSGGISPKFYARLCQELNLKDKNSGARVVGFTPFTEEEFVINVL